MQTPEVQRDSLVRRIYNINEKDFDGVAMEVWKYQYENNALYRSYCELLKLSPDVIRKVDEIPFLPIAMFRQHDIKTGQWEPEKVFRSSGTTCSIQSRHFIRDLTWYHNVAKMCFSGPFGVPEQFVWIGLLPSYLDRPDSSLVDMVQYFMTVSNHPENIFFPKISDNVIVALEGLRQKEIPTVLTGVSFALLDLFDRTDVPVWDNLLVMETGGMKGRGQEITRDELYIQFRKYYKNLRITSEYGMTELLSQAYLNGEHFVPGLTMRVFIRDISDPLRLIGHRQRGIINIIDLSNIDTCAFLATDDVGISYPDGSFDVLGRVDNSDLRGCNLMYV
jgi:hypothetical protein